MQDHDVNLLHRDAPFEKFSDTNSDLYRSGSYFEKDNLESPDIRKTTKVSSGKLDVEHGSTGNKREEELKQEEGVFENN